MLLANVYVELLGERQATLGLGGQTARRRPCTCASPPASAPSRSPRGSQPESEQAHRAFVRTLGAKALWLRYTDRATGLVIFPRPALARHSATCSPEPPNAVGKSFIFGRPSFIGRTVSA